MARLKLSIVLDSGAECDGLGRAVLDVLRRAGGPLTTADIAERIIAERGWDTADRGLRSKLGNRAGRVLRDQRLRGGVRALEGPGPYSRWELAG